MANTVADQQINQAMAIANGGTSATSYTNSELVRCNAGGTALESAGVTVGDFATDDHTHTAVDVTDFDTEVGNHTDVTANTSARHTQNTDTGTNQTSFIIDSGNTGPRIKNNSGVLEIRNNADADYADLTCENLTVKGTTTTIESETLSVYDTEIILNADFTGDPDTNCKVVVERGNSGDANLLWDESSDVWKAGVSGAEATISLAGHTHTESDITDWPLAVTNGGTGISTITQGHILYATGADTIGTLANDNNKFLKSSTNAVAWATVTWADVDKTTSSLADITTRAYSALTGRPGDDDFNTLSVASPNTADDNDYILIYDDSATAYAKMARSTFLSGIGGNPGGSQYDVQYNADGSTTFGGESDFAYNPTGNILTLNGTLTPGASNNLVVKMGDAVGTNKISFTDSSDGEVMTINSDGDIGATDITADHFYLSSRPDYTVTNNSGSDRTIDVDACTIGEMADLLGNVIADLITAGVFL